MTVTHQPIYPQAVRNYVAQILPADASNLKTICTGAADGSKIESLSVTCTETNLRDLQFYMTIDGVDYLLDTVTIGTTSGFANNTAPQPMFSNTAHFLWLPYDANGNRYLYVPSGAIFKAKSLTTLATGKAMFIFGQGGDF